MSVFITDKASLLNLLHKNSSRIKSYGVSKLGLFGSFARDSNISTNSDVDLLVEFEISKKNFDNLVDLGSFLEELLNRKIELVTPQSLSKYIGPHILNQVQNVDL